MNNNNRFSNNNNLNNNCNNIINNNNLNIYNNNNNKLLNSCIIKNMEENKVNYYFVKITETIWDDEVAVLTIIDNISDRVMNARLRQLDK